MASTLKRRRIIVLVHKSLVPPDDISKLPFEEIAPYKTEFDVREGLLSLGHEWQLGLTSRPWALVPMGLMVLYLIVLGIYPTDFSTAWPSALFCVGVQYWESRRHSCAPPSHELDPPWNGKAGQWLVLLGSHSWRF